MKLPEPTKYTNGALQYQIADRISATIEKTQVIGGGAAPHSERWTLDLFAPRFYCCATLPTRKACIAAIPRLLRAMP